MGAVDVVSLTCISICDIYSLCVGSALAKVNVCLRLIKFKSQYKGKGYRKLERKGASEGKWGKNVEKVLERRLTYGET